MKYELITVFKCKKEISNIFNKDQSLIIVARDEENKRINFLICDFYPFFYIPATSKIVNDKRIKSIVDENKFHYITNEKMLTVYLRSTKDVVPIRSLFERTYESDVLYELVFKCKIGLSKFFSINKVVNKIKIFKSEFIIVSYKDIITR